MSIKDLRAWYKPDFDTEDGRLIFDLVIVPDDEGYWVMRADPEYVCDIATPFIDNDWIIEQFTGILDIEGKKLYAGDVVYIAGYGNYICEFPFLELYEADAEGDVGHLKGNIHEHKELIEN